MNQRYKLIAIAVLIVGLVTAAAGYGVLHIFINNVLTID